MLSDRRPRGLPYSHIRPVKPTPIPTWFKMTFIVSSKPVYSSRMTSFGWIRTRSPGSSRARFRLTRIVSCSPLITRIIVTLVGGKMAPPPLLTPDVVLEPPAAAAMGVSRSTRRF